MNKALTPKEIDERVLEFLRLDELNKKNAERMQVIKTELETQYKFGSEQREVIAGVETMVEKVPVNRGKNKYNVPKLRTFLAAIRKIKFVIKTIEIVDVDALLSLVKNGQLPEQVLENCRENEWTHKSTLKRIENVAQNKGQRVG